MRIAIATLCVAIGCRGTASSPRQPTNAVDAAYGRFTASAPAVASGALGTFVVLERDGAIAIGSLERAGVAAIQGTAPAVAVSSDRLAVAAIADGTIRVTLLDRDLKTVASRDLGAAYRGARIAWDVTTSQWVVAWSRFEPLTDQEIAAIAKRGELVPMNKKRERVHSARVDANGAITAEEPAGDGEVVDLVTNGSHVAILTQRLANDLPCKPALPSVHEIRLIVDGADHGRTLVRACGASVRHLRGRLVARAEGYGAVVAGCAPDDSGTLVALRFDATGAPTGRASTLGPVAMSTSSGALFDVSMSAGVLKLAAVHAGTLVVTELDAQLEPTTSDAAGRADDARAIAIVERRTDPAVAVFGESRSELLAVPKPKSRAVAAAAYEACR